MPAKGKRRIDGLVGNPNISTSVIKGIIAMTDYIDIKTSGILTKDGLSADTAGDSAAQLKTDHGYNTDGVYWINLPTVGPKQVYCIMDSSYDGGGWMMAMKATRGTTFNYDSAYWTTTNVLNDTDLTRNDADAKYQTMNFFKAKDIMAIWPDISSSGLPTSGSISGKPVWTWLENNFNINSKRIELVNFFSSRIGTGPAQGGRGLFKRDAKLFTGWRSGIFSSQVDIRFYGFNYQPNAGYGSNAKVRWGFGWNENADGLFPGSSYTEYMGTNDVSGGIGMSWGPNYSAGDYIACCQDTTGINRSARVEVYIR